MPDPVPKSTSSLRKRPSHRKTHVASGSSKARAKGVAKLALRPGSVAAIAMEEARRAGLLEDGDKEHVSVRVPKGLLDKARRQTGTKSPTELVTAALALAAQSDPVAAYLEENFGQLGEDFDLEY